VHEKFRTDRVGADELWVRGRGDDHYSRFGDAEVGALRGAFSEAGRQQFWEL